MHSFSTYLKKNVLKLWLANLLGYLATNAVMLVVTLVLLLIGTIVGFASIGLFADSFSALFDPNSDPLSDDWMSGLGIAGIIFFIALYLVIIVISIFVYGFMAAGQFATANEAIRTGRTKIGTYFTQGFQYTWKITLQYLLIMLMVVPIYALLIIAVVIGSAAGMSEVATIVTGIIVLVLFLALIIVASMALIHAPVLLIAEQLGPWQAIKQSFRLFRQNASKVFVTALLCFAVSIGFGLLGILILLPLSLTFLDPTGMFAIIGGILFYIIEIAFLYIGFPLLMSLTGLIITYRYYKYFKPESFNNHATPPNDDDSVFTFKND